MQLFKKRKKEKKLIRDITHGEISAVLHLNETTFWKFLNRFAKPHIAIPVFSLVVVFVAVTIGSPFGRANVATFYFSSCLGGWENSINVAGESELENPNVVIADTNSAVLKQSVQPIFCGAIQGDPIPNTQIRSTNVKLVMDLIEKNTLQVEINRAVVTPDGVIIPEQISGGDATSTTEEINNNNENSKQSSETSIETSAQTPIEVPIETLPEPIPESSAEPVSFNSLLFSKAYAQEMALDPELVVEEPTNLEVSFPNGGETSVSGEVAGTTSDEIIVGEASDENEPFLEVLYSFDGMIWTPLGTIGRENWRDIAYGIPIESWDDLYSLQISVQGYRVVENQPDVYIESMPVEISYEPTEEYAGMSNAELGNLPVIDIPADNLFQSEKSDYKSTETVKFQIDPYIEIPNEILEAIEATTTERTTSPPLSGIFSGMRLAYIKSRILIARNPRTYLLSLFTSNAEAAKSEKGLLLSAVVTDPYKRKGTVRPFIYESDDKINIDIPLASSRSAEPGRYELKVRMLVGSSIVESTENFTWGVLALNVEKAFMTPNEPAKLQIASLDWAGHTLCDAKLRLTITNDQTGEEEVFSSEDGSISVEPTCGDAVNGIRNNYTDKPDHVAFFTPPTEGTYTAVLENLDSEFSITDELTAKQDVPFVVERFGASRLNPFLNIPYEMKIKVEARVTFTGEIIETVPSDFEIVLSPEFKTRRSRTGDTEIFWPISLNTGSTTQLVYKYKSPPVSPMLYMVGPLKFVRTQGKIIQFTDARAWRLASDASCVSASSGEWTVITWTGCASGPQSGDDVIITDGHGVILDTTTTIKSLTMGDASTDTDTFLQFSTSSDPTLTVSGGDITINGGASTGVSDVINVGGGTLTANGTITFAPASATAGMYAAIWVLAGTLNANNGITFSATADMMDNQILSASTTTGIINLGGAISNIATADIQPGTESTFNYSTSTVAQTVVFDDTGSTYNTLNINNTSTGATLGAAMTATNVVGNVTVQTGTLLNGGFAMTGTSGKTFQVNSGANFKMTGSTIFPTVFTISLNATSNVYYNQDTTTTVSSQSYGNIYFEPSLTASRTHTIVPTNTTVATDLKINPGYTSGTSPVFTLSLATTSAALLTVTGTTTITRSSASVTSVLDTNSTNNNALSSGRVDLQTGGTLTANASTITLTGTTGILFTRVGTFTVGGSTVVMNPDADHNTAGDYLTSGTVTFNNLTLSPTITASRAYTFGAGALTINGDFITNPDAASGSPVLTVNMGAGIAVANTKTITITRTGSFATSVLVTGNNNLNSGKINIQAGGALDATGTPTITLGSTSSTLFTLNASGTFTAGNSMVTLNSAGAFITLTSGAITFYDVQMTISLGASRIQSFGSGAIVINHNLTINPNMSVGKSYTVNLGDTMTVLGTTTVTHAGAGGSSLTTTASNRTFNTGTFITGAGSAFYANGSTVTLTGTDAGSTLLTLNGGAFTAGTSEVIINSDASVNLTNGEFTGSNAFYKLTLSPTITGARAYTFGSRASTTNNFIINPTAGSSLALTVNLGGDIEVGATATTTIKRTTSATSVFDTNATGTSYNLTAGHIDIQTGGTLDATSATSLITLKGDWTNTGTFAQGNSTTTFLGTGAQAIHGSNTFYNLDITTSASRNVTFDAGTTQTIASGGTVIFQGATSNLLTLQSSSASSDWNFAIPADSTRTVDYTAGIDANATDGAVVATNSTCLRTTNWSCSVANTAPVLSNGTLNGGNSIILNEGTFKLASSTFLVTDADYCSTISSVVAKTYLASTSNSGTTCVANDLNCYTAQSCVATTTGNDCGALDTTVEYDCGFKFWYISTPTDATGWNSSIWSVAATATDSGGLTGTATNTNSGQEVEIITLSALEAGPAIGYGSLNTGDTSSQQTTYATSTGNIIIDVSLQASDDMCTDHPTCSGTRLSSTKQEFSLTPGFSYGGGTPLASTSASNVDTDITWPTATTSDPFDIIYWLLQVPSGQSNATYNGITVFSAISAL